ncbi:MAG TPA: hypothetical protein ACQGQH_08155 [Xylella sp.]
MTRGRKRRLNPNIPAHIDPSALPRGIYWQDGCWYVLEDHPEGGRRRKRTVAGAAARLSDWHAIIELACDGMARGTTGHVFDKFHLSTEFTTLADATKADDLWCAQTICRFPLKDGTTMGTKSVDKLGVPTWQRLVEIIAQGQPAQAHREAIAPAPSKANHMLRYARRAFAWGIRFGHCTRRNFVLGSGRIQ